MTTMSNSQQQGPTHARGMWAASNAQDAMRRLEQGGNLPQQQYMAIRELLVVAHSIRRILIWVMVVVPIVVAGLWLINTVLANMQTQY